MKEIIWEEIDLTKECSLYYHSTNNYCYEFEKMVRCQYGILCYDHAEYFCEKSDAKKASEYVFIFNECNIFADNEEFFECTPLVLRCKTKSFNKAKQKAEAYIKKYIKSLKKVIQDGSL